MNSCPQCQGPMVPLFMPGSLVCKQECDLRRAPSASNQRFTGPDECCTRLLAGERIRAVVCPHGKESRLACKSMCFVGDTEFWVDYRGRVWMSQGDHAPYGFETSAQELLGALFATSSWGDFATSSWGDFTFERVA